MPRVNPKRESSAAGARAVVEHQESLHTAPDAVFRVWRQRLKIEFEAAAAFRALARDLLSLYGENDPVAKLSREAAEDEIRHADLCRRILTHGPAHNFQGDTLAELRLGPERKIVARQALYNAVAMGCVTESLSTALLIEMKKRAARGMIYDTVHEIAVDEVKHSRIGWAQLARAAGEGDIQWLGSHVTKMIQVALNEEIDPLVVDRGFTPNLSEWGILPRAEALGIMRDVVEEVIRPGLQHFGLKF